MSLNKQFGGKVRTKDVEKYRQSPNWDKDKFVNLIETKMDIKLSKLPGLLKENISHSKRRSPDTPIPVIPFSHENWHGDADKFIWYGHSVGLLKLSGLNILIDPMLGPNASPIAPFKTKRFSENTLDIIETLPELDMVLLTHDHYDHLDLESIKRLKSKVKKWHVALGISRHLESWGIPQVDILEYDWWDSFSVNSVHITFTPSRHFSGRGAFDRAKSLWGGWALKSPDINIYWSGDGGYGPHFKEIGTKLGPFDWGMIECGQYNENWHAIHMFPEESVQAAKDAGVRVLTPVHWGGFSLALHSWKDPVKKFYNEGIKNNLVVKTPEIGEIVVFNQPIQQENWWINLK